MACELGGSHSHVDMASLYGKSIRQVYTASLYGKIFWRVCLAGQYGGSNGLIYSKDLRARKHAVEQKEIERNECIMVDL